MGVYCGTPPVNGAPILFEVCVASLFLCVIPQSVRPRAIRSPTPPIKPMHKAPVLLIKAKGLVGTGTGTGHTERRTSQAKENVRTVAKPLEDGVKGF